MRSKILIHLTFNVSALSLLNNQVDHKVFSVCFLFSVKFFLQLLCISLVPMIFPYSAQILLENALFCRQYARLKNLLFCSKFCRQNLSKPSLCPLNLKLNLLYFMILCCKGRKDTIVPDGSQFTRYNLSVLSLCLKERPT